MTKTKLFGMILQTIGGWVLGTFLVMMFTGKKFLETHSQNELVLGSMAVVGMGAFASLLLRVGTELVKDK